MRISSSVKMSFSWVKGLKYSRSLKPSRNWERALRSRRRDSLKAFKPLSPAASPLPFLAWNVQVNTNQVADSDCRAREAYFFSQRIRRIRRARRDASSAGLIRARLFPLLELGSKKSRHVPAVAERLTVAGYAVSIEAVPYEFQRGGNEMMRVRAAGYPLISHPSV